MFTFGGTVMAKRGRPKAGSPPKAAASNQSPQVRIDPELLTKLNWIVEMKKLNGQKSYTAASFVEPLIRDSIESDYGVIQAEVESIKHIKAKAAQKMKQHDAGSKPV